MSDQPSRSASARRRLAMAQARAAQRPQLPDAATSTGQFFTGTFTAVEAVDGNLSRVTIGGQPYRYVPKLSSAGVPGAGHTVLLVKVGTQMILLGEILGLTALAPQLNVAP